MHDKNHEVEGFVYEADGNIVGLAHYRRMPSPLRGQDIGFLDDLFVDPKHRGQKIGEKLINKMKEISKSRGWNLVKWITRDDNLRAKSLYDRVAKKTNLGCVRIKMKKSKVNLAILIVLIAGIFWSFGALVVRFIEDAQICSLAVSFF